MTLAPGAAVATAKCRGSHALPARSKLAASASAVVCEINRQRRRHGLAAISGHRRLRKAGARYAADMVARHYFSHISPEGRTMHDRLRAIGYISGDDHYSIGEALATGNGTAATPAGTVRSWMHSPPHRALLLSHSFRQVGIGIASGTPFGGSRAATYVAEFGARG